MLVDVADDPVVVAHLRWQWARDHNASLPACPGADFVAAVGGWMADPTRTLWVAGTDQPAGMVCLTEYTRMPSPSDAAGGRWGYLGHLYVRVDARGRGVGGALVDAAIGAATDRGYAKVVLSPSARSIPLYEHHGFVLDTGLMMWTP